MLYEHCHVASPFRDGVYDRRGKGWPHGEFEMELQTSQNRSLPDLPRASRPHDSACHDVARRIVGTGGPGEA